MPSQSKFASVEQDGLSKVPVLSAEDVTPAVMCKYKNTCLGYFENKEIEEKKQVRKILAGLMDNHIQDWISVDHEHFAGLTFIEFMAEFRAAYLPEDWEEVTWIELLAMTQGADNFWDFSVAVQAKNSLLHATTSYQDKENIRHRLEAGMNAKLALRCCLEKSSQIKKFESWLNEVKCVDDLLHNEQSDFEAMAKASREASRRSNVLTEPSRRGNNNAFASGSANSTSRVALPRLLDSERKLLYDNNSCLKCHCVFVSHRSNNCPNEFPNAASYKTLTQAFVDLIKQCVKKPLAAVVPQSYEV